MLPISIAKVTKSNSKKLFDTIYSLYPKAFWPDLITKCGNYSINEFNPFENQPNCNYYTKPGSRPYLYDTGEYVFIIEKDFSITTDFENYKDYILDDKINFKDANLFINMVTLFDRKG